MNNRRKKKPTKKKWCKKLKWNYLFRFVLIFLHTQTQRKKKNITLYNVRMNFIKYSILQIPLTSATDFWIDVCTGVSFKGIYIFIKKTFFLVDFIGAATPGLFLDHLNSDVFWDNFLFHIRLQCSLLPFRWDFYCSLIQNDFHFFNKKKRDANVRI